MEVPDSDVRAVTEANRRFYVAFEARDLDRMSDVWDHDDDVVCTHPGWRTLHGWGAVSASWFGLFSMGSPIQFILTAERVRVLGDVAWVTVDENILGDGGSGTVAAINLFRRRDHGWKMVAHHGSPVSPGSPEA